MRSHPARPRSALIALLAATAIAPASAAWAQEAAEAPPAIDGVAPAEAEAAAEEAPAEPAEPVRLGGGAPAKAELLYQEGLEAYRTKLFDDAAQKFDEALKLYPTSAKLAKLSGMAWEQADRAAAAIKGYELYLELAPFPEDQDAMDLAIARLKPKAEQQRSAVSVRSKPAGARVYLNARKDQPLGQTPIEVKLDPGSYVLLTHLKGFEADRRTVIVQKGSPLSLDIALSVPGGDVDDGPKKLDWRMPAGFALIGLGAAGTAVGVYFGIQAKDTQARIEDLPAGEKDDYDRLESEFDGQHTGAIAGYAAGGVCLAAGAGLIVWKVLSPATAPEAAPPPTQAAAGTGLRWAF